MSDYQPMSAPPPEGQGGQGSGAQQSGARGAVEPPPSIRTAVNVVWGIVAISLISLVLTFVYLDDIVDAAGTGLSADEQDAARVGAIVGAVFFGLVFAVLWAVMGIFLKKGKNWARIVLTVLAVLGILGGLFNLFGEQPVLLLVVSVITVLLEIALLFFLYRKDSSAFLKAH